MGESLTALIETGVGTLISDAAPFLEEARLDAYPDEGVGIICIDATVYPLINQARSHKRFAVSERLVHEAQMQLQEDGFTPVAFYHTHPSDPASPSAGDMRWMEEHPHQVSVIVGNDGIAAWWWDEESILLARILT